MKKKIIFRGWVEKVLGIIVILAIMIIASECNNNLVFVLSHIGAGLVLIVISFLFLKYGRNCD